MRLHTGMDARRSRLPEKPVNIGFTAQKARKQGDGPPARGTRSPNKGIEPGGSQKSLPAEGSYTQKARRSQRSYTTDGGYKKGG